MKCPICGRFMGLSENNSLLVNSWNDRDVVLDTIPSEWGKSKPKLKKWVCAKEDYNLSQRKWIHN